MLFRSLEEVAKNNKTLKVLFGAENKRKSYQEYILRYFALKNFQSYSSSIGKTMNDFMEKHQNDSIEEVENYKKEFKKRIFLNKNNGLKGI